MSRSRKKTPIIGFAKALSDQPWKAKAARAFRAGEVQLAATLNGDALPARRWARVNPASSPKDGKQWLGAPGWKDLMK